jgi:raffinose/stachyose/melibiose transport system permease protein
MRSKNPLNRGRVPAAVAFMAPSLVLFGVFIVLPIIMSAGYSMTNWNGLVPPKYIQFNNYIRLFKDEGYLTSLFNNAKFGLLSLVIRMPLAFIIAYAVSTIRKGYRFYRAVAFLPVVISSAIIGAMFSMLLNNDLGPVNSILRNAGLGAIAVMWLSDKNVVFWSVSFVCMWQIAGIDFVLFLAGIQSIPNEILESARMDGASSIRTIRSIMLPMMSEVVQIDVILVVTSSLRNFDIPWVMTWGGPGYQSSFLTIFIYRAAFWIAATKYGYSSAVSITIILYAVLFIFLFKLYFFVKERYYEK